MSGEKHARCFTSALVHVPQVSLLSLSCSPSFSNSSFLSQSTIFPSPSSQLNLSLEPFAAVTTSRSRSNCPAEQDKLSLSLSFSVPTLSLPGCSALRLKTESTQAFSKRNIPNSLQPSKPMSQRAKQPESSRACGQSLSRSPDNTFCSPIQFLGLNRSDSNKPK